MPPKYNISNQEELTEALEKSAKQICSIIETLEGR